VYYDNDYQ